jgi:hypothetical protein
VANNTTLNVGTLGDVIQTEDNAGVKTQIVKNAFGTAGTVTLVSASNPQPVVQTGTLNVGTVTAVTAITNALPAGANVIGALTANQSVNNAQINGVAPLMGNGVSGTGAQRVTIASDSTGILAAVTNVATIGTSVTPGVGATHLGKAEDAVHADGDTGVMALAVRRDANTTLVSATGDYSPLQVDASGNLKVAIISGAGSGGTALADAAAFTRGTTSVTPIAGVVETSAPTLTNGNTGTVSLTTGGAVRVDVTSGGIAGVNEDAASAGGEQGVLAMGARQDTLASSTSADGDFAYQKFNSVGALYTSPSYIGANAILTGNGVTGTGSARVTIASDNTAFTVNLGTGGTGATSLGKAEDAAAASGDTGVPVFAVRRDAPSSDVSAAGDYATLQVDSTGQLWTRASAQTTGGFTPVSTVSAASTNATSLKASAGTVGAVTVTSVNAAMRYLKFYNKASAPTVGTDTPVYVLPIPGNTAGAGATVDFGSAGLAFGTGIAWALTTGAAVADTGAVAASEHVVSIAYI